ncbi:PGPGW domain-containing protein [Edaphobacter modestus]|uniref:PGPGW domain-containing protein n=1 Tax=Edaphobacter modestus TaxID=388466 RepID=UPI003BF87CE5
MHHATPGRSGWVRKAIGWFLLAAGIAGCVLPIIPGIPLAIAGLIILGRDYAWARSLQRRVKRKVVEMRRRARTRRSSPTIVTARPAAESEGDS